MSQHTPKPWEVAGEFIQTSYVYPANPKIGNLTICHVSAQGPETDANARLIASAPESLEALKLAFPGFVELHEQNIGCPACFADEGEGLAARCPAVRQIEAAIAKAEGR